MPQDRFAKMRADMGKPGELHRELGVPMGRPIPAHLLELAAKRPGAVGKRARLALVFRNFNHGPPPKP